MPTPLPSIEGVDNTQNWLAATRAGIVDRQLLQNQEIQRQNRLTQQSVGNALVSENQDMPESQKIAAQNGNLDLYKTLHDQQLEAADKAHQVTYGLLSAVDTPEKFQIAINAAKAAGIDVSKYDAIGQKYGWQTARDMAAAETGKSADLIQQQLALRTQQSKQLGEALIANEDPAVRAAVLQQWQREAPWLQQHLDETGNLKPGSLEVLLGRAGLGKTVYDAESKADIAANKAAAKGGGGGLGAAGNIAAAKIKAFRDDNPDVAIPASAQQEVLSSKDKMLALGPDGKTAIAVTVDAKTRTSFDAAERVVKDNQAFNEANPDKPQRPTDFFEVYRKIKGQDISQQRADTAAKKYNPAVTAANAYARKGSESNVKLDAQLNRLASVKDQIQQIRNMVGNEGTDQRSTAESGVGWINNHIGKQYWGPDAVAAFMGRLGSKVSTLQDELAQYVQNSGNSSDTRAKKAYEVVGDLQNSKSIPVLLSRLDGIEETIESLRKSEHINAAGGGVREEETPRLKPGKRYKFNQETGDFE